MNQNLREDAMMEEAIASAEISMETPDTEGCCGEWTGKDSYDCDKDGARTKPFTCKCLCHIKTNTPDTEWRERLWEWVEVAPSGVEVLNCYPESVVAIIEEAISSRDTYWKERVEGLKRKLELECVEGECVECAGTGEGADNPNSDSGETYPCYLCKGRGQFSGYTKKTVDTLLDNLK